MDTPLELLKKELSTLRFVASSTRSTQKRLQARELIIKYEVAIQILENHQTINHDNRRRK
jgi:hypothetical protein